MDKMKDISVNRKAFHDYHILERYEAGIVLKGSEIKSIRLGRVNLKDAYAKPENEELWLFNAHIAAYQAAINDTHKPDRPRKLLLHRRQIDELAAHASQKGLTLVPLRIYIKNGKAKLEIGVGKGKRQFDKRESIQRRETEREVERAMKSRTR
jgi:SsrA-binding protein